MDGIFINGLNDSRISNLMLIYSPLWNIKPSCDKRKLRKRARKRRELHRRVNRELYENASLMSYQRYILEASKKGVIIL